MTSIRNDQLETAIKDKIWVKQNDNDLYIVCDVCLDDTEQVEEGTGKAFDSIVICDVCQVAVH